MISIHLIGFVSFHGEIDLLKGSWCFVGVQFQAQVFGFKSCANIYIDDIFSGVSWINCNERCAVEPCWMSFWSWWAMKILTKGGWNKGLPLKICSREHRPNHLKSLIECIGIVIAIVGKSVNVSCLKELNICVG